MGCFFYEGSGQLDTGHYTKIIEILGLMYNFALANIIRIDIIHLLSNITIKMIMLFTKYIYVGILNTALHWSIFFLLAITLNCHQAASNLIAFAVSATFSFLINAKYTFNTFVSKERYYLFILFMGTLSFVIGYISDLQRISPFITLIEFSLISLICGFLFSKFIVFKAAK